MNAAVASPAILPPRPRPARAILPLPVLLWAIRRNVLATWGEPAYELDIVSRPFLGRRTFLVNQPAAVRRVLVEAAELYGRPASVGRLLGPVIGAGLFLAEGEAWRRQRRSLQPMFGPRTLARLVKEATHATDAALDAFGSHGRHAVDLLGWCQRLTLRIAARVLFGLDIGPFEGRLRAVIESYGAVNARPGPGDFLLPAGIPGPADVARRRAARGFRALIGEIVAHLDALPPADPPESVLDLLRTAGREDGQPAFAFREIEDQLATLLVAGHETTALLLFWAFYLLALDRRAQERAAAEALAWAGTDDGPQRLLFIRAVLDEALRLYPPAFSITREARAADRLGSHAVAPGDLVVISPWVLHRHRRYWRHPDAFWPERFLAAAEPVDRMLFLPFGAGPRACIGARFALDEAAIVLARTLRRFWVELVRPRPVLPVGVVTLHPDHRPPFRLRPRGPAAAA